MPTDDQQDPCQTPAETTRRARAMRDSVDGKFSAPLLPLCPHCGRGKDGRHVGFCPLAGWRIGRTNPLRIGDPD